MRISLHPVLQSLRTRKGLRIILIMNFLLFSLVAVYLLGLFGASEADSKKGPKVTDKVLLSHVDTHDP